MKIAIYSRKSRETDSGQSIKNQISMCKNYFKIYSENPVFNVFSDDGFSGSNTNRPAFKNMMLLAKQKAFDIIAVYKIDRIARNITDFFSIYKSLEKYNIKIVSVTENFDPSTPIGKMMMTMLAGFADMERENIRQRVKDNLYELAKLGRWSGGKTPYGYKSVKINENGKNNYYLELIPTEKEKIQKIFELAISNIPYHIANQFSLNGKTIINILRNPVYMISDNLGSAYFKKNGFKVFGEPNGKGFIAYNRSRNNSEKLVAVGKHEGCVSSELWIKANIKLNDRAKVHKPRISEKTFLGNICKCACGAPLHIASSRIKANGKREYFFRCKNHRMDKTKCNFISFPVKKAEIEILNMLQLFIENKSLLEKYLKSSTPLTDISKLKEEISELKTKINNLNTKMNEFSEKLLLLNGAALIIINNKINDLSNEITNLNTELLSKENKILELSHANVNTKLLISKIKSELGKLKSDYSIQDKQAIIRSLFTDITIDEYGKIFFNFNDVI